MLLHLGEPELPSQIHANQGFDSDQPERVVVAAVAGEPLVVDAETAHCTPDVQVGAAFELGVGVAFVSQIKR